MTNPSPSPNLTVGQPVRVLVPTLGDDGNGEEQSFDAGAFAVITSIVDHGAPQHDTFTVAIEGAIVNVFDATDGPIRSFLEPIALTAHQIEDPETYISAAETHGSLDDPDHEVGDLQQLLRAAFGMLSPDQKRAFFLRTDVREVLESAGAL